MRDNTIYLRHMLDELEFIRQSTDGVTEEAFLANPLLQHGIVRAIEVLGEAVKNISDPFRDAHPEIPWRDIAGARDKFSHGYFEIELDLVWDIVQRDVPDLQQKIERLLDDATTHSP